MLADRTGPVLILGGTAEANALARELRRHRPDLPLVLSLAGRTKHPNVPNDVALRIGGFGGADGLVAYLRAKRTQALIDATHPFAAQIARNAQAAGRAANVPHLKLVRPPWEAAEGDRWHVVADEAEAAAALPREARPFVALGSQHLSAFAARPDLTPILRMIEPPPEPFGFDARIVFARPGTTADEEAALFAEWSVTHLVSRNSGGTASAFKIAAARRLALPVILIERPASLSGDEPARDVRTVVDWVLRTIG